MPETRKQKEKTKEDKARMEWRKKHASQKRFDKNLSIPKKITKAVLTSTDIPGIGASFWRPLLAANKIIEKVKPYTDERLYQKRLKKNKEAEKKRNKLKIPSKKR